MLVLRELPRARVQSLPDSGLMKLLADENIPRPTVEVLRGHGGHSRAGHVSNVTTDGIEIVQAGT
jgi:hypothetical protein